MKNNCCCELFGRISYHARDNPHDGRTTFHCPVHGMQSRYELFHTEKEEGCVPCNAAPKEVALEKMREDGYLPRGAKTDDVVCLPKASGWAEEVSALFVKIGEAETVSEAYQCVSDALPKILASDRASRLKEVEKLRKVLGELGIAVMDCHFGTKNRAQLVQTVVTLDDLAKALGEGKV